MRFLSDGARDDLTYADVFLVPRHSEVSSRYEVDIAPCDGTAATVPLVAANMNAVTGPRLAASLARRGGLGVLPQDLGPQELLAAIDWVKAQPIAIDGAYRVPASTTVAQALEILPATPGYGFVVTRGEDDLGVVPAELLAEASPTSPLGELVQRHWLSLDAEEIVDGRAAFDALTAAGSEFAPVVRRGRIIGTISRASALRSTVYRPNLSGDGRLALAAAVGINGDVAGRAKALVEAGVDALVLDTAHGHQAAMLRAIETVRALDLGTPIVAGNIVTGEAVRDLVAAGADILKVGVGPGAMCTTRMMTAVGRPQFSAVLETAEIAAQAGTHVWADGGVRFPRDVALALAAGAASVMIGSWFAGTIESPGLIRRAADGSHYKTNWGMASAKAVEARFARLDPFDQARKALFSEGISESQVALDPGRPSVEDLVDEITTGVRSACAYAGARSLAEFRENAVIGKQSAAGYDEGRARDRVE